MDEQTERRTYETPQVVDYGDLQELTAACQGGSGGDYEGKSYGKQVGTPGSSNYCFSTGG